MKTRLLLLSAVIAGFTWMASADDSVPALNLEFTYYHWQIQSLLKTSEDMVLYNTEIVKGPEKFKVKLKSTDAGSVQIEALGKKILLTYSESTNKYSLNGHKLNLTSKSSFADIHREIKRSLDTAKQAGLMNWILPEAHAILPVIVIGGLIAADLWIGAAVGAVNCLGGRYPGGVPPGGKQLLFFVGGPIALYYCAKDAKVENLECPASFAEPAALKLANHKTFRVKRDDSGKPTFVSLVDDISGKELFNDQVVVLGSQVRVGESFGKAFPREWEFGAAAKQLALYCSVAKGQNIESLLRALDDVKYSFPDLDKGGYSTK